VRVAGEQLHPIPNSQPPNINNKRYNDYFRIKKKNILTQTKQNIYKNKEYEQNAENNKEGQKT
jgi:hypothetical protein